MRTVFFVKSQMEKFHLQPYMRMMISELAGKAFKLAKKITTRLKDVLGCDGYNIVQNNGEVAGQTVFHFHMHLIPRYKNDKSGFGWKPGKLTDEDRDEILEKLKEK